MGEVGCRIRVYNGRIHIVPLDSPSLGYLNVNSIKGSCPKLVTIYSDLVTFVKVVVVIVLIVSFLNIVYSLCLSLSMHISFISHTQVLHHHTVLILLPH